MLDLDPDRCALVLIDLQKGILGNGKAPRTGEEVVRQARLLADRFRVLRAPVFRVRVGYSAGNVDRVRTPTDAAAPIPPGGLPADWLDDPEGLPRHPDDIDILKRQWNAFFGTELDLQLRRRGRTTVVLGGLVTPFGVESTARAGWELNHAMVFPEDLSSAAAEELHAHAFTRIFPRLGRVTSTAAVLEALAPRS